MSEYYSTIIASSEGVYKEKGSKFIAYAFPASSVQESLASISEVKQQHPTARHHCWAYRLGYNGTEYRVNDDGEPSNSAGKPILGQLESFNVTCVCLVVVRYFGGTLLGVGGLMQAYKEASKHALEQAIIKDVPIPVYVTITSDFVGLPLVMNTVSKEHCSIQKETYTSKCVLECKLTKMVLTDLQSIANMNGNIVIEQHEQI